MNPVHPSPWNKWFPHEPVPSTPQVGPYKTPVVAGGMYHYCTCGESTAQPWCESPGDKCAKCPEFAPRAYEPRFTETVKICGCKKAPDVECNGTCVVMWCDVNTAQAGVYGFGISFVFGVFLTWMMHP